MIIFGTVFSHKRIHKTTPVFLNHIMWNQIDHICVNEELRRTTEDVRAWRGADIASDHHLVVAKLKLKLKKH
uniref:SJCHGC03063 protein n=1 Tax=Schistosoma japonicum TaxID=6182 RepID=Q5BSY2_SCHJA|nr:SJCHGC03063 protein [Schistosoma japonicum]